MLELKHITKIYQAARSTRPACSTTFSLAVPDGQFVSVVGSNGSGKTSMLNIICGSIDIEEGQVLVGGKKHRANERISPPPHRGPRLSEPRHGTCPTMTILENIALADNKGKPFNLRRGTDKRRIEFYREQLSRLNLGLEDKLNVRVAASPAASGRRWRF